ncbi:hypothetical protein PTTG_27263 [Puccinia triticina 1-1 BBBD Race 1]|uniref:RING-type domain-containing protein n=2 Tax=Puccinia triticina TaxID=208348 RepID=A0A180GNP7_PUCT1|nr:uncharacterized protein PtA15_12A587 [Puccinia triticina]OAV93563.1 hypothetical protein PTTG_27263 [Puccinia triticina 1-1 BBBD Race 1]WAQ90597.1 hypothetical protein PtA15_12A587 [Puccinia triticina]
MAVRLILHLILIRGCWAMNSINRWGRIDALKESRDVSSSQGCATAILASGHESHTPVPGLAHRRKFNHRNSQESRETLKTYSSHPELNEAIVIDVPDDFESGEAVTWREFQEHCPICLTEWALGEETTQWNGCGHEFHRTCIDEASKKMEEEMRCPLCRRLPSGEEAPGLDDEEVAVDLANESMFTLLYYDLADGDIVTWINFLAIIKVFIILVLQIW